jgi:hypothetical protein
MAHQCGCSHKALSPVRAEQTVGDVVRDDAGALDTLLAALNEARPAPA